MNENLNKTVNEIWGSLTDEQKTKAKACKTFDELLKLAGAEGVELPNLFDWKYKRLFNYVPLQTFFAAVSRNELTLCAIGRECVNRQKTIVLTAATTSKAQINFE